MGPRTGAFSQRQAQASLQLKQEYAEWTIDQINAAHELAKLGLRSDPYVQKPPSRIDVREEDQLDESGFFPEEMPLQYVAQQEQAREDGEVCKVHYKRIAIRKAPSLNARVLGAACEGESLLLFEWDETKTWRKLHLRLRGGHGNVVEAWVMMRHPQLGSLVLAPGDTVDVGATPACPCGNVFDALALFCSRCGGKRPGSGGGGAEAGTAHSVHVTDHVVKPAQPRGFWPLISDETSVAPGNVQVLNSLEISYLTADDVEGEPGVDEDGFQPVSLKELVEVSTMGSDVYEVCHRPYIAVRKYPDLRSEIVGTCLFEHRVDTYGWDESGLWKRVFCKIAGRNRYVQAWIMVEKEGVGPLLKLV